LRASPLLALSQRFHHVQGRWGEVSTIPPPVFPDFRFSSQFLDNGDAT